MIFFDFCIFVCFSSHGIFLVFYVYPRSVSLCVCAVGEHWYFIWRSFVVGFVMVGVGIDMTGLILVLSLSGNSIHGTGATCYASIM